MVGDTLCPGQSKQKIISLARPGRDGPQIVLTIWVSNFLMSLTSSTTISEACRPVALIMAATILLRLSKSPCAPCTLSGSVDARAMHFKISGPEATPSMVRTPAPSERNSVLHGKGNPCSCAGSCLESPVLKATDFLAFTPCLVTVSQSSVHHSTGCRLFPPADTP